MRHTGQVLRVLTASAAAIAVGWLAAADGAPESGFGFLGIQDGLKRSPLQYVAALLEVAGPSHCQDPTDASTCVNDATLVEVLASRGGSFQPGNVVSMVGRGGVGTRYLAFLVPLEAHPGTYGATFLSLSPTEEERQAFADDLKKAGL